MNIEPIPSNTQTKNQCGFRSPLLLGFLVCALVLTIQPEQVYAAANFCVNLLRTDDANAPYLSTQTTIDPLTGAITESLSPIGMKPAAFAPDQKHVVYWQPLQPDAQPAPLGFYLHDIEQQTDNLLTTLNPQFVYNLTADLQHPHREPWATYWRWSPDGKSLAYVGYASPDEPEKPYLGIAAVDGTQIRADLTPLPQSPGQIFIHGWSADNQYLAFSVEYAAENLPQTLWVWKVGDSGSKLQAVPFPNAGTFGKVRWTTTGHKLVVLYADGFENTLALWSPEAGILSQIALTLQYNYLIRLEWSPDGKHLVINDCSSHCYEVHLLIGTADDRLTAVTDKITRNTFPNGIEEHSYRVISWFDNGDALISFYNAPTLKTDLVRLNLNTNVDDVLQEDILQAEPAPDGQATVFVSQREDKLMVDLIGANGSRKHVLDTDYGASQPLLFWSADNRYIALVRNETSSMIASVDGGRQWAIPGGNFVWLENDWIVYVEVAENKQQLHLLNLKSDQTFAIGQATLGQPIPAAALSPDRQKIIFRGGENELRIFSLETGQLQTLTTDRLWLSDGQDEGFAEDGTTRTLYYPRHRPWMNERLAWSPDSSQVAFLTLNADLKASLNIVSANNFEITQPYTYAAKTFDINYALTWTPCG